MARFAIASAVIAWAILCMASLVQGMGQPPSTCTNLQTAKLLQTRLLNVTSPSGMASNYKYGLDFQLCTCIFFQLATFKNFFLTLDV